jgi:hypothetical protein
MDNRGKGKLLIAILILMRKDIIVFSIACANLSQWGIGQ